MIGVKVYTLDRSGRDVLAGSIVWDGVRLIPSTSKMVQQMATRPICVPHKIDPATEPVEFLKNLYRAYRGAYLRVTEPEAHLKYAKYSESQPRDDHGRFSSAGAGAMVERLASPDGGFTYNPATGAEPSTGFALSLHPERSWAKPSRNVTPADLADYYVKNRDLFDQPGNYLGGWHDPVSDKVFLDISTVTQDAKEAERLALQHDQIAYFDLGHRAAVTVNRDATSGGVRSLQWLYQKIAKGNVDKPELHLLAPERVSVETLAELHRKLTGRDATAAELEEMRVKLAEQK